jgi:exonuclease SbcC
MPRYIIHLSDLHIRNGDDKACRYEEYDNVFNNLFESIKTHTISHKNSIIIITGDIFHNKNVIGNYGLTLYKKLIENLTQLAPTIIFHGNHDRNQNEVNQPSLISSTLKLPNLTILKESQSFIIDNVGFSYLSIDDTLDSSATSGRINSLPSFPSILQATKYKIALFHGTFANVKLYNGTEVPNDHNPYPFELLEGFDFALLGDIHLRQKGLYKNTLWGYSGSLIQQNYGEDIIDHGYMIWDLENPISKDVIKEINVYNDYGFINVKEEDGILKLRKRGKYESLEETIKSYTTLFPKNIEIKLYSDINIEALLSLLNKYHIQCSIISNKVRETHSGNQTTKPHQYEDVNLEIDKHTILEYFNKYLSADHYSMLVEITTNYDNLLFDVTKYPEELHYECYKRNKEISALITNCLQSADVKHIKQPFNIKYLQWENLYCYEGSNWIDFSTTDSSIFLISGNNGTGKSAVYDIITLAIWGDITTNKQNNLTRGIINCNHIKAYTKIDIELNNQLYRIHREFEVIPDKNAVNKHHTSIYKFISDHPDNEIELIKRDNACTEYIKSLFGTLDEFLCCSMITQNMDNNILKLNYKDCISVIDNAVNIEYIYHFYNLLKVCHNKYIDFRKIIESKKQVYERIMASIDNSISETEIITTQNKLELLKQQHQTLTDENNSIAINLNDSNIEMVLATDYEKLLNDLLTQNPSDYNTSDTEYQKALEQYNELKILFKSIPDGEIELLAIANNDEIDIINIDMIPTKPCEYSLITAEEQSLSKYYVSQPQLFSKFRTYSMIDLETHLHTLSQQYIDITNKLRHLNETKPSSCEQPSISEEQLQKELHNVFRSKNSLEKLKTHCNNIQANLSHTQKSQTSKNNTMTYASYQALLKDKIALIESISNNKKKLEESNNQLNDLFQNRNDLIIHSRPAQNIQYRTYKEIQELLDGINLSDLLESKINLDNILERFYADVETLEDLKAEALRYEKELQNLQSQEEYHYDPNCKFCCKRPWVHRIKYLEHLIKTLKEQINTLTYSVYDDTDNDYINVYVENQNIKQEIDDYELYTSWGNYYHYKEKEDHISVSIQTILKDKEVLSKNIRDDELVVQNIIDDIDKFNAKCCNLFETYTKISSYKLYTDWKASYDQHVAHHNMIQGDIENIKDYLFYENTIKPHIEKLENLKKTYNQWYEYDSKIRSIKAKELCKLKKVINIHEKKQDYIKKKKMKEEILTKYDTIAKIKEYENQIEECNKTIMRHDTIKFCNNSNEINNKLLADVLEKINNTIEVVQIIIDHFKSYRIELYDNHILKNLMIKTNRIIDTLCHSHTKQFQLDYLLTETKDIIHINWLVRSVVDVQNEEYKKQIISVHQASGFQQFVISLALRMSLFGNKQCDQLFIDEGFTACDKLNLSIVPTFLKSLLNTFNSIIIVSHIDIIKDSIDNTVHIYYDKHLKTSKLHYGIQKEVHKKRAKKQK